MLEPLGVAYFSNGDNKRANKRANKIISKNNEARQQAILNSYEKGVAKALQGQNGILRSILKATENTPVVFPISENKYLIERGNKKEIKKIKK